MENSLDHVNEPQRKRVRLDIDIVLQTARTSAKKWVQAEQAKAAAQEEAQFKRFLEQEINQEVLRPLAQLADAQAEIVHLRYRLKTATQRVQVLERSVSNAFDECELLQDQLYECIGDCHVRCQTCLEDVTSDRLVDATLTSSKISCNTMVSLRDDCRSLLNELQPHRDKSPSSVSEASTTADA